MVTLDFSQCKTPEDVKKVFDKSSQALETASSLVARTDELLKDLKVNRDVA